MQYTHFISDFKNINKVTLHYLEVRKEVYECNKKSSGLPKSLKNIKKLTFSIFKICYTDGQVSSFGLELHIDFSKSNFRSQLSEHFIDNWRVCWMQQTMSPSITCGYFKGECGSDLKHVWNAPDAENFFQYGHLLGSVFALSGGPGRGLRSWRAFLSVFGIS